MRWWRRRQDTNTREPASGSPPTIEGPYARQRRLEAIIVRRLGWVLLTGLALHMTWLFRLAARSPRAPMPLLGLTAPLHIYGKWRWEATTTFFVQPWQAIVANCLLAVWLGAAFAAMVLIARAGFPRRR
ncbi:MAG TPA: hypothetical protein VFN42_06755 [Acetobacteraceae bacterium]|nr:hypothetical protein [Acetobacteraceae bacterium]